MTLNREEIAWAGGFFEGEGSIGAYVNQRPTTFSPQLRVFSSDRDSLERFQAAINMGRILSRGIPSGLSRKPQFVLTVTSWEKIQAAAAMLWPFLGRRRKEQVRRTLARMKI